MALLGLAMVCSGARDGGAAELDQLYTVAGVAVDATAKAAAAARELAIAAGQRAAYRTLLRRLTLSADYQRHPTVSAAEIPALIQSFEVANERTSSKRYLAELTFQFKKTAIRNLLRSAAIPFTETVSRPILVVPVLESGGGDLLWEEENPWLVAWTEQEDKDRLMPLLAPLGDLEDLGSITAEQAIAGDESKLAALAARYGAAETLVAVARIRRDTARREIRLDISLARYGGVAAWHDVDSVASPAAVGIETVLKLAVQRIADRLEEDWKRQTLLRFGDEMALSATVVIDDLASWMTVRRLLAQTAEVRNVEIASLTSRDAQVILHFLGDPNQLAIALAQRELELTEADGYWTLRLTADARNPGAQ